MENLLEHTGTLIVVRCWCGIQFAIPESLRKEQIRHRDQHLSPLYVHCPVGHHSYPGGKSQVDELREELNRTKAAADQTQAWQRDQRERAERRAAAARGQVTRIRNRVGNGVCPCCKRTVSQLARHMETKHPDFKKDIL